MVGDGELTAAPEPGEQPVSCHIAALAKPHASLPEIAELRERIGTAITT